jgi:hypothetical protein
MTLRGQRLACGLRPELAEDLLQEAEAGTEGIAIVLDDLGQREGRNLDLLRRGWHF